MAHRSTVKGAASFRRLLKALPDTSRQELLTYLNNAGPVLANAMKAKIPVLAVPRPNRTAGAARDSIKWKVTPSTLNLKVGEITKKDIVFYAHILDVGRKAKNVKVTRGGKVYPNGLNVSPLTGLHITSSIKAQFRLETLPGYHQIMDNILAKAARGAGDD